jgi:energy-coupling factor transport system permease protein
VDWLVIGLDLALVVTLRLMLLSVIFVLFFGTTTPAELCLALEKLRVPYRYAFSVGLAFESLSYLSEEWHSVREAQQARGIGLLQPGWRSLPSQVRNLVGLVVPAIVLTTKRAWSVTEAAYARGFDSPHRLPFRTLAMRHSDWLVIAGSVSVAALFTIWR